MGRNSNGWHMITCIDVGNNSTSLDGWAKDKYWSWPTLSFSSIKKWLEKHDFMIHFFFFFEINDFMIHLLRYKLAWISHLLMWEFTCKPEYIVNENGLSSI